MARLCTAAGVRSMALLSMSRCVEGWSSTRRRFSSTTTTALSGFRATGTARGSWLCTSRSKCAGCRPGAWTSRW